MAAVPVEFFKRCPDCHGLYHVAVGHLCHVTGGVIQPNDPLEEQMRGPDLTVPLDAKGEPIAPPHESPDPVSTIYLAGPMTGFLNFNAEVFARYAKKYRDLGYRVISPPELDNGDYSHDYAYYIRRDMKVLLDEGVESIYLIPGWHKSRGACLEKHIADILGIPLFDAETGKPWEETILQEAYRLVHGDRGEDYGHPFDDFAKTVGAINALFGVGDGGLFNRPMVQEEWAMAMIVAKVSRQINLGKRENPVDMAGYAETLQMVVDERARRMRNGLGKTS